MCLNDDINQILVTSNALEGYSIVFLILIPSKMEASRYILPVVGETPVFQHVDGKR